MPWKFQLAVISAFSGRTPVSPNIVGIDLDSDGTAYELLPGARIGSFNRGLGTSDLERLVGEFNQTWAGKRTPRNQLIPTLRLPQSYDFGDSFSSQDIRLTKIFQFRERYRFSVFGESFNLFNIANLGGYSFNLADPTSFGQPTVRTSQIFGSGGAAGVSVGGPVQLLNMPDCFNLASYFVDRHIAEGRGHKTALVCEGRNLTYAQVRSQVNQAGNGLRVLGVRPGDRVMLLLPDGSEFVAAYFGAAKIGAVAVPTSTFLRTCDYMYFLQESQARVLLVDPALWPEAQAPTVIRRGEEWDAWVADQSAELEPAPTTNDDIAFWLWTSGSTGSPKAAVHRHRDWMYCCNHYAQGILGIGPQDLTFSTSKLFHAYGLGNSLLFAFYAGATTALYPGRPLPKVILEKIEQLRPTLFFSVPTHYAAMLAETDTSNPYRLSSVRLAVSAAEPLTAEIYRRWHERFGIEILDGLGSTEALHIYVSAKAGEVRPGSSGRPVPGYEVRVTEDGDLWVKGESVSPYYWNRPELSAARMQDGWFFTGDKYTQDADGFLWYGGRSDDMFRVSGEWVSPIEIEAALAEHPAVLESAVVSYTDGQGLVKPKACVVLKPGRASSAAELQDFVKQRIAPYKYPRRVEFLTELPKTATGKIQRFKLRDP